MSDLFLESITRQVQAMFSQTQSAISDTQRQIAPDSSGETAQIQLTPQQVLGVMQGNSEWMQQFEMNLESTFARLGNKITQQWMEHTDAQIRRSISDLTRMIGNIAGDAINSNEPFALNMEKISTQLGGIAGNLAGAALQDLLTSTRRTVSETTRSREATVAFRSSRGQQQADLSRELARGRRYE